METESGGPEDPAEVDMETEASEALGYQPAERRGAHVSPGSFLSLASPPPSFTLAPRSLRDRRSGRAEPGPLPSPLQWGPVTRTGADVGFSCCPLVGVALSLDPWLSP